MKRLVYFNWQNDGWGFNFFGFQIFNHHAYGLRGWSIGKFIQCNNVHGLVFARFVFIPAHIMEAGSDGALSAYFLRTLRGEV